jgi:hypothetical protein
MIRILVVCIIPVAMLVIQNTVQFNEISIQLRDSEKSLSLFSVQTYPLVRYINFANMERERTVTYLSYGGGNNTLSLLLQAYQDTDQAIADMTSQWPSHSLGPMQQYVDTIHSFRAGLDTNATHALTDAVEFYNHHSGIIIESIPAYNRLSHSEHTWKELVAFHMLLLEKDHVGLERAYGSMYLLTGKFIYIHGHVHKFYI